MAFIYKITNIINNKIYIGKTEYSNPTKRWKQHLADYKREYCKERPLYKAFNKYGIDNFSFEIIEETNVPEEREKHYIELYQSFKKGYNATLGRRWKT